MIYQMPTKPRWTTCSIPAGRVFLGTSVTGAGRSAGGAVPQAASTQQGQRDGAIKPHARFNEAGADRLARP